MIRLKGISLETDDVLQSLDSLYNHIIQIIISDRMNNKKTDHSLAPDIYTGWKMHSLTLNYQQFPLYFTNNKADMISKTLTSFGHASPYRVVFMGPRYLSNHKAFKTYCRNYEQDDQLKCQQHIMYGEVFQKFEFLFLYEKQKIFPIHPFEYRLFNGMNPTVKKQDICFDANFECGNLDLAILVSPQEYDLLMRVDSNTKGNTTWFYFKVSNIQFNQRVKFNLINFQKSNLLYEDGMKPYCWRQSAKKWQQGGVEVMFKHKQFRYDQQGSNSRGMKCLSFEYQFKKQDGFVYFAYCIPYSYSYMLHKISKLQKENPHFVQINKNSYLSSGGLSVPLLTITNSIGQSKHKPVCLAIARLHPGQTQGSWAMDGFLEFICSPKGYYLREKFVFKVFPMVNVDGVVLGNFRTSIAGRDLNRVFDQPKKYTQIQVIRSVAQQFPPFMFLDFHGHSAKKNVFTYGPDYGVQHKEYMASRILPKIISKLTPAFRYYSCVFRISNSKVNAARSIMLREHHATFSFTIESSSYAYGSKANETLFDDHQYRKVGMKIAEGLEKFIGIYFTLPKRLQKQKNQALSNNKNKEKPTKKTEGDALQSNLLNFDKHESMFMQQQRDLFQQIMRDEQEMQKEDKTKTKEQQSSNSDFSQGNEYSQTQLKQIIQGKNKASKGSSLMKHVKKRKKASKKLNNSVSIDVFVDKSPKPKKLLREPIVEQIISKIKYKNKLEKKKSQSFIQEIPNSASEILTIANEEYDIESEQARFNKLNCNNWRKKHSSLLNFENLSNKFIQPNNALNHITLDYQGSIKRNLEPVDYYNHNQQESQKMQRKKALSKNKSELYGGKDLLFPIIQKNSKKQHKINFLHELIHENERMRDNYARKNIKIIYF